MTATASGYEYPATSYTGGWRQGLEDLADSAETVILKAGIPRYPTAAVRAGALPSPATHTRTYLEDTGTIWVYSGSAWLLEGGRTPFASRSASAAITFPTTVTKITNWNTSIVDDNRLAYSSGTFTVSVAGIYGVSCRVAPASTAQAISLYLYKNGSMLVEDRGLATTGGAVATKISEYLSLAANDTIDFYTIGGSLNVGVASAANNRVSLKYTGPAT